MNGTPAGWYPDPTVAGHERYWDGAQWTNDRRPTTGPEADATDVAPAEQDSAPTAASPWRSNRGMLLLLGVAVLLAVVGPILALTLGRDDDGGNEGPDTADPADEPDPSTSATTPTSPTPAEEILPPLTFADPVDAAGTSTATTEAESFVSGDTALGEPEILVGATLTHFTFPVVVDDLPVAVSPVKVSLDSDSVAVALSGPDAADWTSDELVRAEWNEAQVAALARAAVAVGDGEEATGATTSVRRLWVPVAGELHEGAEVAVTEPGGDIRWIVTVDAARLAVTDVRAELLRSDADCEPSSGDGPMGCVAVPDPNGDAMTVTLEVDDASGTSGLTGEGVTVLDRANSAKFVDDDGNWNTSTDDEAFRAVNAFYWTVATRQIIAELGYPQFVEDELTIFISDTNEQGLAHALPAEGLSVFGILDHERHTADDAQIVVHELGHHLLYQAAPLAASSAFPDAGAYNEANADLVTLFMAAELGLDDLDCLSRWGKSSRPDGDCLRHLASDLVYPDDFYATLSESGKYAAGRVWSSAVRAAFVAEVEAAGGDLDGCESSPCAELARRFLGLLAESWPMTDVIDFSLPQSAQAVIVANDALGVADPQRLRNAFESHGLLTSEGRALATVLLAHGDAGALAVELDVTDATGTVLCATDRVPVEGPVVTIDVAACETHLPATNESVWRATVHTTTDTSPGKVVEFAIRQRDGALQAVRPANATTAEAAGSSVVVTIPDGLQTDVSRGWRLDAVSLSGVAMSEAENVLLMVELLNDGPELVAYDLSTGEYRWRSGGYSYGEGYTGIAASFVMFDDHAVLLVPDEDESLHIRSLALGDGSTRWEVDGDRVFSLRRCGAWLCVSRDDGRVERLDPATGAFLADVAGTDGELQQATIGEWSVSMSEGSTPTVRAWDVETGATIWSSTPGEEFGADTAGGWHTQYRESLGLYLVSVGPQSGLLTRTPGFTAALDAETGAVRWVRENTWLPTGFPSLDDIYLITYDVGFGLSSSVDGRSIERVNPETGTALVEIDEIGDPFLAPLGFSADGSTIYWRSGEGGSFAAGRNMRTGADAALDIGLAWERVDRSNVAVAGDDRSVPDGHAPVDLTTGETAATTQQPDWIGVSGTAWTAYVTPSGAVAVARR